MPYDHLEEIQSRKGEKIAMFLTIENAFGMVAVAFPIYLVSIQLPFVLRVLLVLSAAALGVAVTVEVGGMSCYERVLWSVRGAIRRRLAGDRILGDSLPGALATAPVARPVPRGGPIRRRPVLIPVPVLADAPQRPRGPAATHHAAPQGDPHGGV
jgi:hypothetical protein